MISAPSEMRCSEMPVNFITTKVMASTSGMAMATTMPGRQPSARKLTASTMAIASIRLLVNSPTASWTTCGWSATRCRSTPIGRSRVSSATFFLTLSPSASTSPPVVMAMASADRGLAVVAEHRLRRVDIGALHGGDVAQAEEAVVGAEVDRLQAFLGGELARDADGDALRPGIDRAARHERVLRLQRLHQRVDVEAERGDLLGRELEIDLLVLHADQIDLGDIADAQELGAQPVGLIAQLAMREAVGDEGVDQRIGVAELVVEERAGDARRQRVADVVDLLAHLVPEAAAPPARSRCPSG